MLLGQRLGGHQDGRLRPGLHGLRAGECRHHRLAGTHLALQKAPHGLVAGDVARHLARHTFLLAREHERQRRPHRARDLPRAPQRWRAARRLLMAAHGDEPQLQHQQFLERQAATGRPRLARIAWEVQGGQGVGTSAHLDAGAHPRGQYLRSRGRERARRINHLAQPPRGQGLGGRIHGHHALGVDALRRRRAQHLMRLHGDLTVGTKAHLPADHQLVPRLQHPGQIRLVEPHGRDRPRGVVDFGAHDLEGTAPCGNDANGIEHHTHGRLLPVGEARHGPCAVVGQVPGRQMLEQFTQVADADCGRAIGRGSAHSGQFSERRIPPTGTRAVRTRGRAGTHPGHAECVSGHAHAGTPGRVVASCPGRGGQCRTTRPTI